MRRQTEKCNYIDRQTDRKKNRYTERQIEKYRYIYIYIQTDGQQN